MTRSACFFMGLLAGAMVVVGCNSDDDGGTNQNHSWNANNNNYNYNTNTNTNTNYNTNANTNNNTNDTLVAEATVSVSGAQNDTWAADNVVNSVYCLEDPSSGWLSLDIHMYPGSLDDSFSFFIDSFTGAGSYSFNYATMNTGDISANVYVGSSYAYWFFYDYSRLDFHYENSDCQISITEPAQDWYTGTVSCTWFPATSSSLDYESDPVEFLPYVNVSATFTCSTVL